MSLIVKNPIYPRQKANIMNAAAQLQHCTNPAESEGTFSRQENEFMYIEKFIIKEAFLKVALLVGIERACSSVPYQTETTSIMQI